MRRLRWFLSALSVFGAGEGAAWGVSPVWIVPDVPTQETASGTQPLPWQIVRYGGAVPSYALELTVPGNPTLDGIERMDKPGNWLFSLESASDLGGTLLAFADPRDVIRYDALAGSYSLFFCGDSSGIPAYSNVDALFLVGGDNGDLALSFDVPTQISAVFYDPGDLLRFRHIAAGCGGWVFSALLFDASAAGIPPRGNVIGADTCGTGLVLSLDVPTELGPPGLLTYIPGQLPAWTGVSYVPFETLAGWPISSEVNGLACAGNPGLIPFTLHVNKAVTPGHLQLVWTASCSQGAADYGIYEGTLGAWYSHTPIDCADTGADLNEEITPGAGNRYYLVVPHNVCGEGSYGQKTGGIERPVGTATCAAAQIVTSCP
jgi:hypothetical protein